MLLEHITESIHIMHARHAFAANEHLLLLTLVMWCKHSNWENAVRCKNEELEKHLNMAKHTLIAARQGLLKRRIIDYTPAVKGEKGTYSFLRLADDDDLNALIIERMKLETQLFRADSAHNSTNFFIFRAEFDRNIAVLLSNFDHRTGAKKSKNFDTPYINNIYTIDNNTIDRLTVAKRGGNLNTNPSQSIDQSIDVEMKIKKSGSIKKEPSIKKEKEKPVKDLPTTPPPVAPYPPLRDYSAPPQQKIAVTADYIRNTCKSWLNGVVWENLCKACGGGEDGIKFVSEKLESFAAMYDGNKDRFNDPGHVWNTFRNWCSMEYAKSLQNQKQAGKPPDKKTTTVADIISMPPPTTEEYLAHLTRRRYDFLDKHPNNDTRDDK